MSTECETSQQKWTLNFQQQWRVADRAFIDPPRAKPDIARSNFTTLHANKNTVKLTVGVLDNPCRIPTRSGPVVSFWTIGSSFRRSKSRSSPPTQTVATIKATWHRFLRRVSAVFVSRVAAEAKVADPSSPSTTITQVFVLRFVQIDIFSIFLLVLLQQVWWDHVYKSLMSVYGVCSQRRLS